MNRTVWRITGGPEDRRYVDFFLRYGVGLISPAHPGRWKESSAAEDENFSFHVIAHRKMGSQP